MVICKRSTKQHVSHITEIKIGNTKVKRCETARNLGIIIDQELNMVPHINNSIRSCNANLRQIAHIRPFLTHDATATLVNSIVTSRLDYVNSLLFELPNHLINRLQLIQNNAARIIYRKRKYDHVTPLLKSLHWLPIKYRIQYKINVITFKTLCGIAPVYLSRLIIPYIPSRTLRSSSHCMLTECRTHGKLGDRAFSVCAPKLWNNLPIALHSCESIINFKTSLKTHYFVLAFSN